MTGKYKRSDRTPWWVARSMKNAGSTLFSNRSSLEGMVGMSSFAPVATPPVRAPERPAYRPEPNPKPEYQPQPEPSGDDYIPPDEPPVRKGGLSWWQTALIAVGVPTLGFLGFLGYNALKPQQTVPVSTPTPVVATATPAPTATYTPTPTQTPIPTATPIPGLENVMSEAQLKATLEEVLAIDRYLTPADTEVLKKLEDINKTLYFMLSGKTFEQQDFGTRIVSREEYDSKVHELLKGTIGTVVRSPELGRNGRMYAYAALPQKPKDLVMVLGSETGQLWLLKEGPLNMDVGVTNPNMYLGERGGEMKDALYRGAVASKITGLGFKDFVPSQKVSPRTPDETVNYYINSDWFFYDAWTLAWAFALDDPEASANLRETGWAGPETLIRIFKYNAMLDYRQNTFEENKARHEEYVNKLTVTLENKASYAPLIKAAIEKRISPEGKASFIGHNTLP